MRKYGLIVIVLNIFIPLLCFAQHEYDVWYFGYNLGLDFRKTPPMPLYNGPGFSQEGCAMHGDPITGQPRIICDGIRIFDRNRQIMPNGDNIISDWSSSQAAIIIPWPCNENIFFVVTTDQQGYAGPSRGSHYSVVDLNLNGGLGDVTTKNVLLNASTDEHLTAIHFPIGENYWILLHSNMGNTFYAYKVSSSGIAATPVISVCGTFQGPNWSLGYLKASPDGRKIVIAGNIIQLAELFDFDPFTGIVSNPLRIYNVPQSQTNWDGPYGVCFSPDNTKVYFSILDDGGPKVLQCDVSLGSSANILKSITVVNDTLIIYQNKHYLALALGPDKKIYVASSDISLSVIENPNARGKACGFKDTAIIFQKQDMRLGLPNMIEGTLNTVPDSLFTMQILKDTVTPAGVIIPVVLSSKSSLPDMNLRLNYDASVIDITNVSSSAQQINYTRNPAGFVTMDVAAQNIAAGVQIDWLFNTATSNASRTIITIDSLTMGGDLFSCANIAQTIELNLPCGDQTISSFMRTGKISDFSIHPNPAQNYIAIESNKKVDKASCTIFDQLGRPMVRHDVLVFTKENKVTLDVSSLSSGMYFLRMESGGFSRSQKVVINH